ncbi:MAG: NAD-dependent epimerase/dehydratase family protein [Candidatus Aminicenantes bacterium]|nr:NAD-dependent epimerase/dehydratase family protein [Candidatus Aminicenantes bacterium]
MEKKILITGVAGFIGSNLALYLAHGGRSEESREHFEVIGIDNLSYGLRDNVPPQVNFHELDIRSEEIFDLFHGVDTVFHLAAKNCISDCQLDPVETADVNVTGTVNVFEAARRAKIRKIVYAESSALYEGSRLFPTPEEENKPESFYAVSKLSSRSFAQAYRRYYGMTFTALRYFCVYGPVQDYRRTIPPVMSAFIIKLLKGEPPIIYGTGTKRRDFVYVDDVTEFHLKCLIDPRTDNKTFNLGSGTNHSVLEIYEIISALLGKRIEPLLRPDLPGEAEATLADISEARKLGWAPKTDLKSGLLKAIEYIKGEMEKGRIP